MPQGRLGRSRAGPVPESGSVTAEFAVSMPAFVLVLVIALSGLAAALDHVRCVDAARLGARALARGDPQASALALAHRAAPDRAVVQVSGTGDLVTVTVQAHRPVLGSGFGWTVTGVATAVREGAVAAVGPGPTWSVPRLGDRETSVT